MFGGGGPGFGWTTTFVEDAPYPDATRPRTRSGETCRSKTNSRTGREQHSTNQEDGKLQDCCNERGRDEP